MYFYSWTLPRAIYFSMKELIAAFLAVLLTLPALAQTTCAMRGRVLNKLASETLPGATV